MRIPLHQFHASLHSCERCTCGLARSHSAHAQGWSPTRENIDALPQPIREYIQSLQDNADMALVHRIIGLETALELLSGRLLDEAKAALERLRCSGNADEPACLDDVEKLIAYFTELAAEP